MSRRNKDVFAEGFEKDNPVTDFDSETEHDDDIFENKFKSAFEDDKPKSKSSKKFLAVSPESGVAGAYDWIRCVLFSVAIVVFCLTFIFRLVEVDGPSMNDTLYNKDKVIITDLFYTPHNGDVIVIAHGAHHPEPIIKRVIAHGGQTIRLDYDNETLYVDGVIMNEPYIKDGITFTLDSKNRGSNYLPLNDDGSFVIPEGKLFVMGDNRQVSLDSRREDIGLIDRTDVIGKAQFVVFPFDHFGNVYDK